MVYKVCALIHSFSLSINPSVPYSVLALSECRISPRMLRYLAVMPRLPKYMDLLIETCPVSLGPAVGRTRADKGLKARLISARVGKVMPSDGQEGISVLFLWMPLLATGFGTMGRSPFLHPEQRAGRAARLRKERARPCE